jgi:hypothetical protein
MQIALKGIDSIPCTIDTEDGFALVTIEMGSTRLSRQMIARGAPDSIAEEIANICYESS